MSSLRRGADDTVLALQEQLRAPAAVCCAPRPRARPQCAPAAWGARVVHRTSRGCACGVAYPKPAGNVLRLLPFRLRRVHQAVVGSQMRFSAPHGTLLARLRRTCPASWHDHRLRQPVTLPEAAATVARDRGEPLAATTRDPSSLPPSLVYTAATLWPTQHRWSAQAPPGADANSHEAAAACWP
jgi:hypothetical protein